MRLELSDDLDVPISVAPDEDDVVRLRAGAVVDGAFVRRLGELLGDEDFYVADPPVHTEQRPDGMCRVEFNARQSHGGTVSFVGRPVAADDGLHITGYLTEDGRIAVTDSGGHTLLVYDSLGTSPKRGGWPTTSSTRSPSSSADPRHHGRSRQSQGQTSAGELLDGRNRVRACAIAGVTPTTRTESSEPWAYVISTNVHRRHLSEAQRAMIGARIAERAHGQRGPGKEGPAGPSFPADPDPPPPTTDEAAQLLRSSARATGHPSPRRAR
jgi:hypothetical protein